MKNICLKNDICCIHGLDADLIVLGLSTHIQNFYILRDNLEDYDLIDLQQVRNFIIEKMSGTLVKESKLTDEKDIESIFLLLEEGSNNNLIDDFVFLSFLFGNDFLPNSPSLEILDGAIDDILNLYKECKVQLTYRNKKKRYLSFNKSALKKFFETLMKYEEEFLLKRTVDDELIKKSFTEEKKFDYTKYMKLYNKRNLGKKKDVKEACFQYLKGLKWVLKYYTSESFHKNEWGWFYPQHYSPFIKDIISYIDIQKKTVRVNMETYDNLFQLLCVLPPKSNYLLPNELQNFHKEVSEVKIEIDSNGKRYDWQYIIKLPNLDYINMYEKYKELIGTNGVGTNGVGTNDKNIKDKSKIIFKGKIKEIDI